LSDYPVATKPRANNASRTMKRVVLTDSRTKAITVFDNPWRLGGITAKKDDTFDVRVVHQSGEELIVNVRADKGSLTRRFDDW
jgi:hypothetical protein